MRSTEPRYTLNRISKEERTRLQIAGGLCALGGMLAVARLFQLQVVQGKELRALAEKRRVRRRPILARRGAILDRWNRPLAHTLYKYHLALDPQSVRNPDALYEMVHTYLKMNPESLAQAIREARAQGRRYLRFATAVPPHRAEPFLKAYRALPFRNKPAIINKEIIPAREYPFSRLAPQVLGVVQIEEDPEKGSRLVPVGGIEASLNEQLQGVNGIEEGEGAPGGLLIPETIQTRIAPRDGKSVRLTLDIAIQEATEQALETLWQKHRPLGALAIVLDPRTGEILAIANRPTFDLATRKGLTTMEALRNRATTFLYEPGSTLKPLIMAMALSDSKVRLTSRFTCTGSLPVGKHRIRCVVYERGRGHGTQSPEEVLLNSCNVAMAQLGMRVGLEWLYSALLRLRLLERTGVELPAEWVGWTTPPDKVRWGRNLREANLAFGQGLYVSPLALAAAYTILANEGLYRRPHILYENAQRETATPVIEPTYARAVVAALTRAVEEGTGKNARMQGYWVAGKTGTAQKAIPGRGYVSGKYIASFIGIVPADRPRAVIMVLADEPRNGYYGGDVCAPVFRQIAQFLMWYWKVPPNRTLRNDRAPQRPAYKNPTHTGGFG